MIQAYSSVFYAQTRAKEYATDRRTDKNALLAIYRQIW